MARKFPSFIQKVVTVFAALSIPAAVYGSTVTFQDLRIFGDSNILVRQFEDGMQYTLSANFNVLSFLGNPPSALFGTPSFIPGPFGGPATFAAANHNSFRFDGYDVSSFAPPKPSDTWLFRGLLNGVEQFSFSEATDAPFSRRTTGRPDLIDRLEIFVTAGSSAALVVDNLQFSIMDSPTPIPEPRTLAIFLLGLGVIVTLRASPRQ